MDESSSCLTWRAPRDPREVFTEFSFSSDAMELLSLLTGTGSWVGLRSAGRRDGRWSLRGEGVDVCEEVTASDAGLGDRLRVIGMLQYDASSL